MRLRLILAGVVVLGVSLSSALAYDISDLLRDARAHHSEYQQKLGDLTVRMEGRFTAQGSGESSISSVHYQKGEKWRHEGEMAMGGMGGAQGGSMTATTLFDGNDVWSLAMGLKTKLSKEQISSAQANTRGYWQEPVEGSEVAGDETIHGRDCWLVLSPENSMTERTKTWIDKKHFVIVRSEAVTSGTTIRTDFSDFRKVEGDFIVPYHYEIYSGDQVSMIGEITELSVNSGLSDDLFDPDMLGGDQPGMMNMDMDQMMKQVEEMKKKAEEMQLQQGGDN